MAEENTQPIIVKKIKKGGHGHHGGAWKIAYADFVTAMMAFFLLMWLLANTTKEQKAAISEFFTNPSPISGPGGASTSMIKVGGGKDITYSEGDTKRGSNPDEKPKKTQETKPEVGQVTETDKERLLQLKKELEQAIEASEALKPFKDQLMLEITKEGLRIQILDKENRPMFASGSSVLQPYAAQILREIGKVINHVPNKISLSGHTDATPYSTKPGVTYSNWELSADRSNASRRALNEGGMAEEKVARVVGLSSAVLFDKTNPFNPVNRRISIIVLNKETENAILHDEGKLDQTTLEAQTGKHAAQAAPAPSTKAAQPPKVEKLQATSEPAAKTPPAIQAVPKQPEAPPPHTAAPVIKPVVAPTPAIAPAPPVPATSKPAAAMPPPAAIPSIKPVIAPVAPIPPKQATTPTSKTAPPPAAAAAAAAASAAAAAAAKR